MQQKLEKSILSPVNKSTGPILGERKERKSVAHCKIEENFKRVKYTVLNISRGQGGVQVIIHYGANGMSQE